MIVVLEPPEREPEIVGSTAAQKVPPGGTVLRCPSCGERDMLLSADQVRDYGRRPTARVWCDVCASRRVTADALAETKGIADLMGQEADALAQIAEQLQREPPDRVTTHFEFDPPEAGAEVQKSVKHDAERGYITWDWKNDMGLMVLITRRSDGQQTLIADGDRVQMSASAFDMAMRYRPARPVRDAPQA